MLCNPGPGDVLGREAPEETWVERIRNIPLKVYLLLDRNRGADGTREQCSSQDWSDHIDLRIMR